VFIRDGGVCQICGDRCDYECVSANGKGVGHLYPTIDHINPLKNGGSHTWDNVQLAHHFCNSKKREHELTEDFKQVISHAKEQAIGNQCA
jgi:5-methylcytosine-specific restriction endonuclease McrA